MHTSIKLKSIVVLIVFNFIILNVYIKINDVVDAWNITLDYDNVGVVEYDYKVEEEIIE